MRERDKRILQSAKLIMAFCAGCFCLLVWGMNPHDSDLSIKAFQGGVDVILFCLGAQGTVMVADSVEAILTRNKSDSTSTTNINVKRDPKDFDVPLEELDK